MKSPKKDSCDILCQIPKGSCILFITPPLIESRLIGLQFLNKGFKNNIPGMYVSLNDSPEMLKEKSKNYGFNMDDYEKKGMLKWIDGYSEKFKLKVKDSNSIKRISHPLALTDISIFLSNVTSSFLKKNKSFKVFFDSISTLTLYNSNDSIFRFLEVITARIKANKGSGFFVLINDMHDSKFVNTVRQMMDGTISLDDDLNMKIVSFPKIIEKKKFKFKLTHKGFIIN
jgi:KaiC/GvpD/RAD55 family RecA-like ATPase